MNAISTYFTSFLLVVGERFANRKDRGVTAIEYGLIASLIAVVIILAVTTVGQNLIIIFNQIAAAL